MLIEATGWAENERRQESWLEEGSARRHVNQDLENQKPGQGAKGKNLGQKTVTLKGNVNEAGET